MLTESFPTADESPDITVPDETEREKKNMGTFDNVLLLQQYFNKETNKQEIMVKTWGDAFFFKSKARQ